MPDTTAAYRALRDAAARATTEDEPLWLVTNPDDLEVAQGWGLIVATVGEGQDSQGRGTERIPGHLVARAASAVSNLHLIVHPASCSVGRARHYFVALRQIPSFCGAGALRCFTAPANLPFYVDPDREIKSDEDREQLRKHYEFILESQQGFRIRELALHGLGPEHLAEINTWRDPIEPVAGLHVAQMNGRIAAVNYAGDFRVVQETGGQLVFMRKQGASDLFANVKWEDESGKQHSSFGTWLHSPRRNTYSSVTFLPEPPTVEPMHIGPAPVSARKPLNLWRGWRYAVSHEVDGSCDRFMEHWFENVAGGDQKTFEWQWNWIAQMVREPHRNLGTAIALRGGQGVGKTIWANVIGGLMHENHYMAVESMEQLTGKLSAHLGSALLVSAEEAIWAGDHAAKSALKDLVTAPRLRIEPRGIDSFEVPNFVRLVSTIHDRWVVPAEFDERRFAIFDVGGHWLGTDRFETMVAELSERRGAGYEALLHDLVHGYLYDGVNPGVIPMTTARLDHKFGGLDTVGRWWADRLAAGSIEEDSWPLVYGTEGLYDVYAAATTRMRRGSPQDSATFGKRLRQLSGGLVKRARESRGERRYVYKIPGLAEARAELERHLGLIPWPDRVRPGTSQVS